MFNVAQAGMPVPTCLPAYPPRVILGASRIKFGRLREASGDVYRQDTSNISINQMVNAKYKFTVKYKKALQEQGFLISVLVLSSRISRNNKQLFVQI